MEKSPTIEPLTKIVTKITFSSPPHFHCQILQDPSDEEKHVYKCKELNSNYEIAAVGSIEMQSSQKFRAGPRPIILFPDGLECLLFKHKTPRESVLRCCNKVKEFMCETNW